MNAACRPGWAENLYPAERILALSVPITLALYWYFGIPLRVPWFLYTRKVAFGLATYALGLVLACFLIRLQHITAARGRRIGANQVVLSPRRDTFVEFYRRFLSINSLQFHLRLVHAVSAMFVVYINLKHLIPYVNSRVYDNVLAGWENALLGGTSPSTLLIDWLSPAATPLLSAGYTVFYPYCAFLTVCMILQPERALAQRFCFAFVLLWFSATLIEYAIPTWGPCFSSPHLFSALPESEVSTIQHELWRQKLFVDSNPVHQFGVFLISGLPSLHFAVALQGSLFLQRVHRVLGILSWIFVAVTSVTTIYFGWHFLADLAGAVLLTAVVQCAAARCCSVSRTADA